MIKKVVFIGGYANSGKTTVLDRLRNSGHLIVSTSETLHQIADKFHGRKLDSKIPEDRTELIRIAEEVLVPVIGRHGLVSPACEKILNYSGDNEIAIFESIGGEEFRIALNILESAGGLKIDGINLRRSTEQPGVDIRELLPSDKSIDLPIFKNFKRKTNSIK